MVLLCLIVHLCVYLFGCETDMSEGYIEDHDLLHFIIIYTNRGKLAQYKESSSGGGQPYSHILDMAYIRMSLFESTFIFNLIRIIAYLII